MTTADVNPEGFLSGGPGCTCGPLYSYAGHVEPGQYAPDCPAHSDDGQDTPTPACRHERTTVVEDGPGLAGGFLIHVCDDCGQDVEVVR